MKGSGAATLLAAVVLGASVLGAAFLLRSPIESATAELGALREALEAATAPAGQEARAGRPDPNRRYAVSTRGAPVKGNPDAKLAVVEFSDFECPFCRQANPVVERIAQEYGDRVRIVFKHMPLPNHPRAPAAHAAAEAAHRQGRFWEMHDRIFEEQRGMSPEKYRSYARELGLDLERFERDLTDPEVSRRVQADLAEAARLGVNGTPAFFINGRFLAGARPFEDFQRLIEEELGGSG